ncbi:MAG TPA: hypothetical protein VGB69_02965 [Edaphobacter sp.]
MTWTTFFDLSTMAHRHLVFVYAGVLVLQLGYAGWVARNWFRAGR